MGVIIHGFAVFLIVFELIIIQCEGFSNVPPLTPKLIGKIISKGDFETFRRAIKAKAIRDSDVDKDEFMQNRIVMITPHHFCRQTREFVKGGEVFLELGNYELLQSFFGTFGKHIKKLEIRNIFGRDSVPHGGDYQSFIKACADSLEDLRVKSFYDGGIWDAMFSYEGNDIIFSNVKKFEYEGPCDRKKFNLGEIFPGLVSVSLRGPIKDANCLESVSTLNELDLSACKTIQEDQLVSIIAQNQHIGKMSLSAQSMSMRTIGWIAEHLTELKSFIVKNLGGNAFLRDDNEERLHILLSVTQFSIYFEDIDELVGYLPFDMPNLKRLQLYGREADNLIIYFINDFQNLDCVEFFIASDGSGTCVEHIKMNFDLTIWTLSNVHNDFGKIYLKFERQP